MQRSSCLMPYLNLGCLHLLVIITELHFWSIDNQYSCCSKTSKCYKINLWLELTLKKLRYRGKEDSWYHVGEVLVLETRKKFHGSRNMEPLFLWCSSNRQHVLQAWILSIFLFFLPSLNVQEITKENI